MQSEWDGRREELLVRTWLLVRQSPLPEYVRLYLTVRHQGSVSTAMSPTVDIGWVS